MTRTRIRPFTYSDLPELHRMVQALAAHHGDAAPVSREDLLRDVTGAAPLVTILIAERDGRFAGYAGLSPRSRLHTGERGMELGNLWVEPDHRGAGVGRALIDEARAAARARGCSYMTVGTHAENHEAQAYYPAAGFEPAPPGGPRFRMTL